MKRSLSLHISVIGISAMVLLAALPVFAKPMLKKAAKETVTIENSGSTNTSGYQIIVSTSGNASYQETGAGKHVFTLSKEVTSKLFTDLAAALPLPALPVRHGMRSASFGTETYITYNGQRSPDLTTPSGPQALALYKDIKIIEAAMHASNHSRRRLTPTVLH